jgi:hypothetical protein
MIPANVTTALNSLQTQVAAASPLEKASTPTITALQLNADALVTLIDNALTAAADGLDSWIAPSEVLNIISGVLTSQTAAIDQSNLALMRGVCGRVAANLDQLGPTPALPPGQF